MQNNQYIDLTPRVTPTFSTYVLRKGINQAMRTAINIGELIRLWMRNQQQ